MVCFCLPRRRRQLGQLAWIRDFHENQGACRGEVNRDKVREWRRVVAIRTLWKLRGLPRRRGPGEADALEAEGISDLPGGLLPESCLRGASSVSRVAGSDHLEELPERD